MGAVGISSNLDEAPRDVGSTSGDGRRRWDAHVIFWASTALLAGTAMIRNGYAFTQAQYPSSDAALNSLLVNRAEHFRQLVGNYSRVEFHHPGPALLYILAAGQGLFHGALHIVPAPYNGQLLAAMIYGAVFTALTMVTLYRLTGSRGATAVALGIAFLFAARYHMLGDTWFPFLYLPAFLLFTVAGAAVAVGRTGELPLFVLAAGVLAHGHVSFLLFVAVTAAVVTGGWLYRHRDARRDELRRHRRGIIGALVLAAVFTLPLAVETIWNYPGQWPAYLHYAEHGDRAPRTVGQIADFVGQYWSVIGVPEAASITAGALAVVLTVTERDRERRRIFLALYGFVLLQSALTVYYVARGVDELTKVNIYVGFFYMTVPLVLVIAAAAQLWLRIARTLAGRVPHWALVGTAALILAALSVQASTLGAFALPHNPHSEYRAMVSVLRADPARAGRVVEFDLDEHDVWPQVAGVAAESARTGLRWCVAVPPGTPWAVLFDTSNTCKANGPPRWQVHVSLRNPLPVDARVIGQLVEGRWTFTVFDRPQS
jgi:hypothetical protein